MSSRAAKSSRRNVDKESRKPKFAPPPAPTEEVDESGSDQESDISETPLPVIKKSESSRFSAKPKKAKSRSARPVQRLVPDEASGDEEAVEEDKVVSSTSFLLAASLHIAPTSVTSFADNKFIPDFHAFFYVLFQMQETVFRNEYFRRLVPHYNSLFTSVYYSVLVLFQVCRSRIAANVASKSESQFARRFEREFPLESLPVASPLLGFFETLGYVCPSKYFEYVCPQLPDFSGLTNTNNYFRRDIAGLTRIPWIPMMLRLLRQVATNDATEINATTGAPYWTQGRTIFGIRFGTAADYTKLVKSAGWYPIFADVYDAAGLAAHRTHLLRFGIPAIDGPFTTVSTFCGLSDDASWSWFRRFAQIAAHEASFFANPTNMSAVSPVGTLSLLVEVITPWNPDNIKFDDSDDADNMPFLPEHNVSFASSRLSAFQRIGSDEEFRAGCVTQFQTGYRTRSNATGRWREGDWFSNVQDATSQANPVIRPTLPVAKYELDFENPLRLTNQIVQEVLYKVEGQKRA